MAKVSFMAILFGHKLIKGKQIQILTTSPWSAEVRDFTITHTHTHTHIHKPTHWAVRFSYWSEQGSAGLANVITECNICVWPESYRDLAAQVWPAGCRKHQLLAVMNRLGSNGTAAQEKVESNGITKGQTEAFSCYNKSDLCENLIFHRFTSLGLFLWALPYCQYTYTTRYFSQTSSHLTNIQREAIHCYLTSKQI